jgi:DNA-binding transcriptional ArsR family regulator
MVEQRVSALDRVFRALADPTRRAMIRRLAAHDCNVGALAAPFRMSLAAASKHVKVLERAGLVRRRIRGRIHLCRINPAPLSAAARWLRYYEKFWNERLDALDAMLRAEDGDSARESIVRGGK